MLTVAELLHKIDEITEEKERAKAFTVIAPRYQKPVKMVLKMIFDKTVVFDVSPDIPYVPAEFDEPNSLIGELRRFYVLTPDGNPNLTREKRDRIFSDMLSVMAKSDVELVKSVVKKKSPFKRITKKSVQKVWPDLILK